MIQSDRGRGAAAHDGLRVDARDLALLPGELEPSPGGLQVWADELESPTPKREWSTLEPESLTGRHERLTLEHQSVTGRHESRAIEPEALTVEHESCAGEHEPLTVEHESLTGRHESLTLEHESLTWRFERLTGARGSSAPEHAGHAAVHGVRAAAQP